MQAIAEPVFKSGMNGWSTMPSELLQYSTVKKVEQKIRWIMLQKSACLLSVLRDNIAFLMQTGSAATQKRSSQSLLSTNGNRTAIAAHIVPKSLSGFGASGDTELFEKASNINGFQGGRVANNLYISPFRATVFQTAALFLYPNSSAVIGVENLRFLSLWLAF